MDIALCILAEIQMRQHQANGIPLTDLRMERILNKIVVQHDIECPGKRI